MRPNLRSLVLAMGLWVGPMYAQATEAGEVDARRQAIQRLEGERAQAETQRRELEQKWRGQLLEVEEVARQRSSWNRDQKLKQKKTEAAKLATALEDRGRALRALDGRLAAQRRALLVAIDQELKSDPDERRRSWLESTRSALRANLGQRRLHVPRVEEEIDPLDDPEDLDEKARILGENETQLLAEEQRLSRRAKHFRRLAKLEKARTRAEEDPFGDDGPRRQSKGRTAAAGDPGTRNTTVDSEAGGRHADEQAPPEGASFTDDADPTPATPLGAFDGSQPKTPVVSEPEPNGDPSFIYADVVEPETIDALKRAERSGSPDERAKASERAAQDVRAQVERLRRKRLEMERRSRELRRSE